MIIASNGAIPGAGLRQGPWAADTSKMSGEQRHEERKGTTPTWLRFGWLLGIGEVIILVAVTLHPAGAIGVGAAADHRATSVGHILQPQQKNLTSAPPPTTTLPVTPSTTVPPTPVTPTTVPPATPLTPASPARTVTVLTVLPANIAPQPNFLQNCSGAQYDDSLGCVGATLQAIANARSHEGLPPMVLPSNWGQLSPEQQIFVATNLERTARGMAPMTAMDSALDQDARQGAAQNIDPAPPGGFPYSEWGSNWAGAVGNPLEAIYFWMYDDGADSANVDCSPSHQSGCWGHRENVLLRLPCNVCVMGTGWDAVGYSGDPSMTELLVESSGNQPVDFTWQQESPYLS
jgi:hypothetical protein